MLNPSKSRGLSKRIFFFAKNFLIKHHERHPAFVEFLLEF